jgi:hypothetical protein
MIVRFPSSEVIVTRVEFRRLVLVNISAVVSRSNQTKTRRKENLNEPLTRRKRTIVFASPNRNQQPNGTEKLGTDDESCSGFDCCKKLFDK